MTPAASHDGSGRRPVQCERTPDAGLAIQGTQIQASIAHEARHCDHALDIRFERLRRNEISDTTGSESVARQPTPGTGYGATPVPPQLPLPPAPEYGAPSHYLPPQRRLNLTGAEQVWYLLQCIYFGAGYLAKVPTKKALSEAGLTRMTGAEQFWYAVLCVLFGAGYFAKVPVKKALNEAGLVQCTGAEQFWYLLECIWFGIGYLAKVPTRKALSDASILRMTDAGQFWYMLMCIYFGAGYFAKIPHKKALAELPVLPTARGPV